MKLDGWPTPCVTEVLKEGQWRGSPCFIIGGGESLKGFDFSQLIGKGKILGVNESWRALPCDACYLKDQRVLGINQQDQKWRLPWTIKLVDQWGRNKHNEGVYWVPKHPVGGKWGKDFAGGIVKTKNSGLEALNIADILGADPLYLLGFDMKPSRDGRYRNWHDRYPPRWKPKNPPDNFKSWLGHWHLVKDQIRGRVINLGPDSALELFPKRTLKEALMVESWNDPKNETCPTPIRIFIGTEPKTFVAEQVLKYSIEKHTKFPVEFHSMDDSWAMPPKKYGTGFSLRRWMIPDRCNFEGRAIYLDADQLVVSDIAELWTFPDRQPGKSPVWLCHKKDKHDQSGGNAQSSVMVIDCERARWELPGFWEKLDGTRKNYVDFMTCKFFPEPPQEIPGVWNDFNHHDSKTKLVHYTKESTQPWYRIEHAYRKVWEEYLVETIKAGRIPIDKFLESFRWIHKYYRKYEALYK